MFLILLFHNAFKTSKIVWIIEEIVLNHPFLQQEKYVLEILNYTHP